MRKYTFIKRKNIRYFFTPLRCIYSEQTECAVDSLNKYHKIGRKIAPTSGDDRLIPSCQVQVITSRFGTNSACARRNGIKFVVNLFISDHLGFGCCEFIVLDQNLRILFVKFDTSTEFLLVLCISFIVYVFQTENAPHV